MSLTPEQRRLLDALVSEVPPKLDMLFSEVGRRDEDRGVCATYSRMLAEVLGEFGIWVQVRPVYVVTANTVAIDAIEGKITKEEAVTRGGKIQIWGDIKYGQPYQHAVCYIPEWDVVVDLAMTRRGSGLVPSHPYWAIKGELPWWVAQFDFRTYPLEYAAYQTYPDKVTRGKEIIRDLVRREIGGKGISERKLQELIDEVPDVDDPAAINYWRKVNGYQVYLEGWSDACLAGTGFPPIEGGMWDEKVKYIKDLTPGILDRKAKEYGLRLIKGGFKEKTEENFPEHLYGVTWGVYSK